MGTILKNIAVLIVCIIAVEMAYLGYIRPEAQLVMEAARAAGQSAPRDLIVILKDREQEICLILMFWNIFLIGGKCLTIINDRYLFQIDLIEGTAGNNTDLSSVLKLLEEMPAKIHDTPLVRTLAASLRRYLMTRNVQDTSDAIDSSVEALAVKLEAENSLIRYLIWAIPSIGFIGTVRGIGRALSQADQALAGDIAGMTESLGLAFNSTLVALIISILLMSLLHLLQRLQDDVVVSTQSYCESFLLNRVSSREHHETAPQN